MGQVEIQAGFPRVRDPVSRDWGGGEGRDTEGPIETQMLLESNVFFSPQTRSNVTR